MVDPTGTTGDTGSGDTPQEVRQSMPPPEIVPRSTTLPRDLGEVAAEKEVDWDTLQRSEVHEQKDPSQAPLDQGFLRQRLERELNDRDTVSGATLT